MGNIISFVSDSVYVYYSKIATMCSRKNNRYGSNYSEMPNESLLNGINEEEKSEDIKINFIVGKDSQISKTSSSMKNEYQLLKNSEDYDFKRCEKDIEDLNKEINEINLIEDNTKKLSSDDKIDYDVMMDLDSLDDLKRQIFDKNDIN